MKSDNSSCGVKDSSRFTLPVGPSDLCFDRHEFLEDTFSVDNFLHEHKKKASLETIRDDLGVYLKVLRSAMIELINKDYADFVNLSSNLIGLDKAIHSIQVPLGQLKEEVLQVKQTLDDSMSEVSEQLEERRSIHFKKHTLKSLSCVENILKKLGDLLSSAEKPLSPDLIERTASEYNRLQFALSNCGAYKTEEILQESKRICNVLTYSLNKMFLDSIKSNNTMELAHCLRVYVTLDQISYAEDLFRKEIIAVALTNVICDNSLNTNPNGLQGVYFCILKFIDVDMKDILEVTSGKSCQVAGFDFLVNSLWPEVEHRLEVNLATIYAPGNPEIFYKRYCETMEFLEKLDGYFTSSEHIDVLHSHPQYKAFLDRWNLPVYFQIRFQEIAGSFETVASNYKSIDILDASSEFHIFMSLVLWNCLTQCWAEGIFLNKLGHRFWKLSLQLLARYSVWVQDCLKEELPLPPALPTSEVVAVTLSAQLSSTLDDSVSPSQRAKGDDLDKRIKFLVHLYLDLQTIVSKLPHLEKITLGKLIGISEQNQSLITKGFQESKQQILDNFPMISQAIVQGISEESLVHLRQVSDIPRLFRRTNREAPTKPCAYVTQVLAPAEFFMKKHKGHVAEHLLKQWLAQGFSLITEQYFSAVNDVLTSVQKTEESLRRLKKLRDRSSVPAVETRGSDDDKIRRQLVIDIQSYCNGVFVIGLEKENIHKLKELEALVNDACNILVDPK